MTQTLQRSLTSRARVVLAIARGVAAGRGDTNVTAIHVAIGLVTEAHSMAAAALQSAGLPPLGILGVELETELGPPSGPPAGPHEVTVPLTPGEEMVVDAASRLSVYPFITPEHLLIAILEDTASPATRVFARYGFSAATAREHLEAIGRATPPDSAA